MPGCYNKKKKRRRHLQQEAHERAFPAGRGKRNVVTRLAKRLYGKHSQIVPASGNAEWRVAAVTRL